MPFYSLDWRGPGEDWVKCQDGWEIKRIALASGQSYMQIVEESNGNEKRRRFNTEPGIFQDEKENKSPSVPRLERHKSLPSLQPFCPITIKCTREVAGFNTLSDVLKRLDFRSAAHDVRRFQYVSSLLRLLLSPDRLFNLPGSCQKLIFRILEEMAVTVYAEKRGEPVLNKLLQDLHSAVEERKVWGGNHGSETLNRAHQKAKRRLACITALEQKRSKEAARESKEAAREPKEAAREPMEVADESTEASSEPAAFEAVGNADLNATSVMEVMPAKVDDDHQLTEIPEECVREILLRLSDAQDLDTAGEVMPVMSLIVKERRIWRELVQAHFTATQADFILNKKPELREGKKFRELYFALKKHFGLRQEFTELVMLCKSCRVLFWQSLGHPCLSSNRGTKGEIPLTPSTFLTFFSI